MTEADADAGRLLAQLEADGLAGETIVFYYGDHGSGMPRSKRWPYDSGLHVPLVVYIPEKFKELRPPDYKAGGSSDRLVSFVDLAPTEEGKLTSIQDVFWNRKAPEELYDLQTDPDEVRNLAGSPAFQAIQARLRNAQQQHALTIRDVGFIPEGERFVRARGGSPYDLGHDAGKYPIERVLEMAELASMLRPDALPGMCQFSLLTHFLSLCGQQIGDIRPGAPV